MNAITIICNSIYSLVKAIGIAVENLESVREEGRKLHRLTKRVEVLVSDLQPYCENCPGIWNNLKELENVLIVIKKDVLEFGAKGPLSAFLQADHCLERFKLTVKLLDQALSGLLQEQKLLAEETCQELSNVRTLLQRAQFTLAPAHENVLTKYRQSCNALLPTFTDMVDAHEHMMKLVSNVDLLTRKGYMEVAQDLRREVLHVKQEGRQGEDFYLRLMLDVIQIQQNQDEVGPLEYLCPLTHRVMQEPVLLPETGHSYEKAAIEEWLKSHRFCPRSGTVIKKLTMIPNLNLRDAIARWQNLSELQVKIRPLLGSLCAMTNDEISVPRDFLALPTPATASAPVSALVPAPVPAPVLAAPAEANGGFGEQAPPPAPQPPQKSFFQRGLDLFALSSSRPPVSPKVQPASSAAAAAAVAAGSDGGAAVDAPAESPMPATNASLSTESEAVAQPYETFVFEHPAFKPPAFEPPAFKLPGFEPPVLAAVEGIRRLEVDYGLPLSATEVDAGEAFVRQETASSGADPSSEDEGSPIAEEAGAASEDTRAVETEGNGVLEEESSSNSVPLSEDVADEEEVTIHASAPLPSSEDIIF